VLGILRIYSLFLEGSQKDINEVLNSFMNSYPSRSEVRGGVGGPSSGPYIRDLAGATLALAHARASLSTTVIWLFLLEVGVSEPSPEEETHEAARAFCEGCTVKDLWEARHPGPPPRPPPQGRLTPLVLIHSASSAPSARPRASCPSRSRCLCSGRSAARRPWRR
jgi:hypothetical protein